MRNINPSTSHKARLCETLFTPFPFTANSHTLTWFLFLGQWVDLSPTHPAGCRGDLGRLAPYIAGHPCYLCADHQQRKETAARKRHFGINEDILHFLMAYNAQR